MTPLENVKFVRIVKAAFPHQKLDEYTADAWEPALADLPFDDCRLALTEVLKREQFASVASIRDHAGIIRDARLRKYGEIVPDVDPDDPRWTARFQQMMSAVRDGRPIPPIAELEGRRAIEATRG